MDSSLIQFESLLGSPKVYMSKTNLANTPHTYMVRRLAFPAPPPLSKLVWYRFGGGGGGRVCGEGWGPLELQLEKRPGVTDNASIVTSPTQAINPIT